jgi:hypothetical protein
MLRLFFSADVIHFYFLICIVTGKYCNHEKIEHKILMNLHVLKTPEYEKWVFGMSFLQCASLAPEGLGGFYSCSLCKSSLSQAHGESGVVIPQSV